MNHWDKWQACRKSLPPSLPEFAEFSHLSCGAADHGRPLGEALRGEKLIRRRFCRGSDQLSRAGDMNKGIAHLLYWMAELGMKLGKYSGYKGLPFTFYVSNAAFMSKLHILKRCLGIFHIHPLANSWTSCLSLSAKTWSIDHLWQ